MDRSLTERLRRAIRQSEPQSAPALAARLGTSQATLSRRLAAMGDEVLRLGRARHARYALARPIGRLGSSWPLFHIDAAGRAHELGRLAAAGAEGFVLQAHAPLPSLMHAEFSNGWFAGLPWFMDDMRPQGFLGRAFARSLVSSLQLPPDPTRWSADEVLIALLAQGHDAPGDLVLGQAAVERALAATLNPPNTIDPAERAKRYPEIADAALQGEVIGSSAGGEQPKFTTTLREQGGTHRACIVKFSDQQNTPGGGRWADLLRCEHLSTAALRSLGLDAADTALIDAGGRRFLEVTRFDRTPSLGRRGVISLRAIDAAFYGQGRIDWWRFAPMLTRDGWINAEDADRLQRLGIFGALIANDDMHLGNASLIPGSLRPWKLAPAYDMLPMRFAPGPGGEIVPRAFEVLPPSPDIFQPWRAAAAAALGFWQGVANDDAISAAFRVIAQNAATRLSAVVARFA